MEQVSLLIATVLLPSCSAIDMKWTPNGEAPAPYSANARAKMGMDPAAMAGQAQGAPLTPPGAGLPFTIGALVRRRSSSPSPEMSGSTVHMTMVSHSLRSQVMVYFANNWKVMIALQEMIMVLLRPFLKAMDARKVAQERHSQQVAQAAARRARAERLTKKRVGDDDDDE